LGILKIARDKHVKIEIFHDERQINFYICSNLK